MSKVTYTMFISFVMNTLLSTVKIILGLFGSSISILIDGIHTFSDMSTDLITISEDNLIQDKDKYLKRIINFVTGFVILGLGLIAVYLSVNKDIKEPKLWLLIVLPVLIILKYILSSYVLEKGIIYNNPTLISNSHENDMDIFSSIIVLLGLIIIQLKDIFPILKYTDMIIGIIVSLFVIKTGFDTISHEINDMMSKPCENKELEDKVNQTILNNKDVININNLELLKYGPYYDLRVDLTLNDNISLREANEVAHHIERMIKLYYPEMEYISIRINHDTSN